MKRPGQNIAALAASFALIAGACSVDGDPTNADATALEAESPAFFEPTDAETMQSSSIDEAITEIVYGARLDASTGEELVTAEGYCAMWPNFAGGITFARNPIVKSMYAYIDGIEHYIEIPFFIIDREDGEGQALMNGPELVFKILPDIRGFEVYEITDYGAGPSWLDVETGEIFGIIDGLRPDLSRQSEYRNSMGANGGLYTNSGVAMSDTSIFGPEVYDLSDTEFVNTCSDLIDENASRDVTS